VYAKEYKAWIARKAVTPKIVETFNTFKLFWAAKITLINQTSILASMHGYRMAAINNNNSVILYGELIAIFGDVYSATQELVKTQGSTIVLMLAQLQAMQQYCMVLQQQPPPAAYAPQATAKGQLLQIVALHLSRLAVADIKPRRTSRRQRWTNVRCSHPRLSSATGIGTTVGRMVPMSTTATPAGCARSQDCRTILLQCS
jgi:hypothetical protein